MLNVKQETAVAKTAMLIRKPVQEVFAAFVDPQITTKFWFTKSTGKLEVGKQVTWTWEMYNHSAQVKVKTLELNQKIVVEWGNYQDMTTIEWTFEKIGEQATFVNIVNSGFQGEAEKILGQVRDSTEGFTIVLAGLKALLEHGVQLNLVGDRFPNDKVKQELMKTAEERNKVTHGMNAAATAGANVSLPLYQTHQQATGGIGAAQGNSAETNSAAHIAAQPIQGVAKK